MISDMRILTVDSAILHEHTMADHGRGPAHCTSTRRLVSVMPILRERTLAPFSAVCTGAHCGRRIEEHTGRREDDGCRNDREAAGEKPLRAKHELVDSGAFAGAVYG